MSLIAYVTRIHFADRVLEDGLAEELRKLGVARPLIVVDAAAGSPLLTDQLLDALPSQARPLGPWHVAAQPSPDRIADEARRAMAQGCDGVIGFGGLLALDAARLLGAKARTREGKAPPVVTLPTTTQSVGLGPVSGRLEATVPALILCDPMLTTATPPLVTAAAGMDALTHCIEAFLGSAWNPPADGIAIDGAHRAMAWLERAVADGEDLDARREMLAAALDAGLATQKGLGGVHALSWAIEAEPAFDLPHGLLHAALLPPVLAFNRPATADRTGMLTHALRLPAGQTLDGAVRELGARIGLPGSLGFIALETAALRRIAARAAENPANLSNPRHATSADYREILEAAM
jgi:alcohol dehydrogenase class IV